MTDRLDQKKIFDNSTKLFLACLLSLAGATWNGCSSYPRYSVPQNAYRNLSANDTQRNVILLTIDGVRWQEVFHGADPELNRGAPDKVIFKNLAKRLSESGMGIGDRENGSEMTVSNPTNISLPAYQSIMTGLTQNCFSNSCSRVPVQTLPERLLDALKLQKDQVATIASWSEIALAAEHQEGSTTINAGVSPLQDQLADPELTSISNDQLTHNSSGDDRFDQYTIPTALWYLKKHRPRFLYISLEDSDELAHDNKVRHVS